MKTRERQKQKKERTMINSISFADRMFAGALAVTIAWYIGAFAQMI